MTKLYDLTCEKLRRAASIDELFPRFCWKIESDESNVTQEMYCVEIHDSFGETVWSSGEVETSENCCMYDGEMLDFVSDYDVVIRVRLSTGETVSGKTYFSTGLMGAEEELGAKWITLPHKEGYTKDTVPAFRKEFTVEEDDVCVKLFVSAGGIYEAYINGVPVFDTDALGVERRYELKPGFTEPLKRRMYTAYDITPMCRPGVNCFSAVVGTGWYSDRIGARGDFPMLFCVITAEDPEGDLNIITSDREWKVSADNPVVAASVYEGEDYDARIPTDFMYPGFDDSGWEDANESDFFAGELEPMHGEPVVERIDRERKPVKIYTFKGAKGAKEAPADNPAAKEFGVIDGKVDFDGEGFVLKKGETGVVDFGQNAAGRECFTVRGKAGTKILIRHGEMLNDRNGERSRGNDGPGGSVYLENMRSARAATTYIIGKDLVDETFEPVHTFYGFRYVQITAEEDVIFSKITAKTITSVGYDSGTLTTGSELVNKLFENGRWGMYSNYVSIPTDCPQRDERLGWTADTQVFTTAAQYYSTAAQTFLEKWMQDMQDSQGVDGSYPSVAPSGPWVLGMGCMGWADAGILVPYYVWKMSGDTTIIDENYGSMKLYMDHFLASKGTAGPVPCYGDWLSFEPNDNPLQVYLGVCYYAWDAMIMSEMADATGRPDDARHYAEIYEKEKKFFIETYVNEDGTVKLPQQTAALFALKLRLLPDEKSYEAVKKQLMDNFADKGNRLQTGFLGTSILLPTLSQYGLNEMAYTLLLQDQMPSWLYSVKAGATTVWERWNSYSIENGFGDVGMNSFNHYAYGCVSEWMFAYMAGIRPESAGFGSFVLAPVPDRRISFCKATYDSVRGTIRSDWHYDGDKLIYECGIPAGTEARVILPLSGEEKKLGSGTYRFVVDA
ncbi:MAG: glycoside hydrolase family 78 protein [Clostridia bacterium]|nr:glycoside hydrolase family 78 protein [Clostridia bacterium]